MLLICCWKKNGGCWNQDCRRWLVFICYLLKLLQNLCRWCLTIALGLTVKLVLMATLKKCPLLVGLFSLRKMAEKWQMWCWWGDSLFCLEILCKSNVYFPWIFVEIGGRTFSSVSDDESLSHWQKTLFEHLFDILCRKLYVTLVFDNYFSDQIEVLNNCYCCLTFVSTILVFVEWTIWRKQKLLQIDALMTVCW